MRRTRSFRPWLVALEGRIALSTASISEAWRGPPAGPVLVDPTPTTLTPEPGRYPTAEAWLRTHRHFQARARSASDPVVFLGDSIPGLWLQPHRAGQSASWNRLLAPLGAANFGIPGDRTENLLWRVRQGELSGRPRVAVVLIGANDLAQGRTPMETARGVETVLRAIREESPKTRLLLLGILPAGREPNDPRRLAIDETNDALQRQRLPGLRYLDIGARLLDRDGRLPGATTRADSAHPTNEAYWTIARSLVRPIRRLLGPIALGV